MKKPKLKALVVDSLNAAIRGCTKLTYIPMKIAETQHRREQGRAAVKKLFEDALDLQAQMNAIQLLQERSDAGAYEGFSEQEIFAEFLNLRAFEQIAIRIK